ncbi:amino acid permease [Pedobacter sp. BS3]|uniref:amino acid permease n=1 Tax=Pedobacter sp. BS3 TaxID=2567937 RepID=UPI0011EBD515|nr:amino acid permease [Pedobacter sp. BS3]TZF83564.1 amino acid permease [Pedobacter sp. BS3]
MLYKKPISQLIKEAGTEGGLKRTLNATNLISLGIGAIIGAGIFTLTGTAAALHTGPAVVLSFILAGVACAFAGLCYSEFASMIPIAGSAYTYAYATMGEFLAWIIGWDLIIEYLFASSTVAVSWSGYVVSFLKDFGIHIPANIAQAPYNYDSTAGTFTPTGAIINFPAMFVIAIITTLLVIGIRESARFNNIIVVVKVAVILLFVGFGISYINQDNLVPFIPDAKGPGEFGFDGIVRGAGIIFFAYIGFDAVSTAAQEAINPQKDMPRGILGSLVICTIIYILVGWVMTGMVNYKELNVPDPIAVAVNAGGSSLFWLRFPIKIGAIAGLSSVILVMLMGQPRIFYSMANDGLLPAVFSKIHPKFKTPYITTIITGIIAMAIAGFGPINLLGELVSIGTLLAFTIVCGGILVLRYTSPELKRPFKTPFFPVVPILGMLTCFYLMAGLPWHTWERLIIWLIIGLIIYFTYSKRHSHIRKGIVKFPVDPPEPEL